MYVVICFLQLLGKWYPKEAHFQWCAGTFLLRCASEACIRHPYLQQILKCQVRNWAWGVQVRWKVRKWESSGCASEAFAVEVWAGIGNWTFSRLYRHAYSKINALGMDLRTPQVSSHSPHRLRNHRAPERAPHTTKSSYSGREIDFIFFPSQQVFCLLKLKRFGITYFWTMGKMEFPPETFLEFHMRSHPMQICLFWAHRWFLPGAPAGSAGPSVKLFWYAQTILNGAGSMGKVPRGTHAKSF